MLVVGKTDSSGLLDELVVPYDKGNLMSKYLDHRGVTGVHCVSQ